MTLDFGILRVRVVRPSVLTVSLGPLASKSFTISEGTTRMDIQLGDNQFVDVSIQGLDAAGLAGKFTKPPVWAVDDATVLTITPAPDGASCRFEAAIPAKLGQAVVTATDADDPNVEPLTFMVTVSAEAVTHLGATISPPQERVAVNPEPTPEPAPAPA